MSETPRETAGNPATTEEWLARISGQLSALQGSVDRFEGHAGEFLPTARALLRKPRARAAAAASSMWNGKGTPS